MGLTCRSGTGKAESPVGNRKAWRVGEESVVTKPGQGPGSRKGNGAVFLSGHQTSEIEAR